MIRQGMVSNEVAALQFALNGVTGFLPKLVCDGAFGPRTFSRVQQHQRAAGLQPDGVAGPLTFDTLFEAATLRGRVRFDRLPTRPAPAPRPPAFGVTPLAQPRAGGLRLTPPSLGAPRTRQPTVAPDLSLWLNPVLAEAMRQQAAFQAWWDQPHPKPPLPTVGAGLPGYSGDPGNLVAPPVQQQPVVIPARPNTQARALLATQPEGRAYGITLKLEGAAAAAKGGPKFKGLELELELEWTLLKGRLAALKSAASLSTSVAKDEVGYSGKGTLSLDWGKLKLFEGGVIGASSELATAIVWEGRLNGPAAIGWEVEASQQAKLDLQLTGKPEKPGLHLIFGLAGGLGSTVPIHTFGPLNDPADHGTRFAPFVKGKVTLSYDF